jgi:PAS domain S-box-containing protein
MKPLIAEPAVSFLVVSLLARLLDRVDDPQGLAATLVEQLRELTGARLVALVRAGGGVAACSPERRRAQVDSDPARLARWAALDTASLVDDPPGTITLVVPLRHRNLALGFLLAEGLIGSQHLAGFTSAMELLGRTAALALRSSDLLAERQAALAAKEQLLAQIMRTAPVGLCLVRQGRIALVNHALEEMSGRSATELSGLSPRVFAVDDASFAETMRRLHAPGGGFLQTVLVTAAGEQLQVQLGASPLDPGDPEDGLVVTAIDISERLRLERALHQTQAMESLGRLAGGVAHDFNNQLAAISGYAELIQQQSREPGVQRKAGVILAAAQRSADLTRQLLAFARRAAHRHESIDLHQLIEEVALVLRRSLDRRIELALRLAAGSRVDGDPSLLQNALLNLALNARDAMPEGGILAIATADRRLAPSTCRRLGLDSAVAAWVEVLVSDTGTGMTPEVQARIFEPFFTTKGPGKGTGLGLAAVHGTVHQMGGAITVDSRTGQGTTFRLLLPAGQLGAVGIASGPRPPVRPLRLLVVDDEPDVRGALCALLAAHGHQVHDEADGPAAISWFREHAAGIDLVLLDLNMPGMNGAEALLALLAIDPAARIAIVTGNAATALDAGVLAHGAAAILEKPLSAATLAGLSAHARPR